VCVSENPTTFTSFHPAFPPAAGAFPYEMSFCRFG
jgi:hypothetical protein